jgi:hypothetical protein
VTDVNTATVNDGMESDESKDMNENNIRSFSSIPFLVDVGIPLGILLRSRFL